MALAKRTPSIKLGKLCHVVTKGTTPTSIGLKFTDSGVPFLRIQNLCDRSVKLENVLFISEQTHQALKRSIIQPKDFLITIAGTIGRVAIVPDHFPECNCNQAVAILRFDYEKLNPQYLLHWLNTHDAFAQITGRKVTATISNLSLGQIKELEIPLPPLPEQQKIASILEAADSLRQKDQQLIEKYTALSQSLFLEMFGDPVSNPLGWQMGTSIQYCECIVPGRDKPKSFSGDIPWVTTNDLNRLTYTGKSKKDIGLTEEEVAEVRAKIIPENSVILTCVGDLGVISINSSPVVINQQLHAFQCDHINISPIFMMYVLSYQTPYMYKMASSTTVPYMNKTVCNNIPMIYPSITLQNQFAERIQSIEAQKLLAIASLEKSATLFNSLLQRAFKGELTA